MGTSNLDEDYTGARDEWFRQRNFGIVLEALDEEELHFWWGLRGFLRQQLQQVLEDNFAEPCSRGAIRRPSARQEGAVLSDRRAKENSCSCTTCSFGSGGRCKREESGQLCPSRGEPDSHVAEIHERRNNETIEDTHATMRSRREGRDRLEADAFTEGKGSQSPLRQIGQDLLLRSGKYGSKNEAAGFPEEAQRAQHECLLEAKETWVLGSGDREQGSREAAESEPAFLVEGGDVTGARKVCCLSERSENSLQLSFSLDWSRPSPSLLGHDASLVFLLIREILRARASADSHRGGGVSSLQHRNPQTICPFKPLRESKFDDRHSLSVTGDVRTKEDGDTAERDVRSQGEMSVLTSCVCAVSSSPCENNEIAETGTLCEIRERLKACFDPVARESGSRRTKEANGLEDGKEEHTGEDPLPVHVGMLVMLHHIESLSPSWIADWIIFYWLSLFERVFSFLSSFRVSVHRMATEAIAGPLKTFFAASTSTPEPTSSLSVGTPPPPDIEKDVKQLYTQL
ncbi:transmembrane protein [Cystoisospora suis]|uniref:Transmembrane protein n=1 Tax=Cystoisospora suis TaxID=483139 RepID=A0A2C6KMV7_9APIC|nr:transmembrane protein [Cystoisospora suis]